MKTVVLGTPAALLAVSGFLYLRSGRQRVDEPSYRITREDGNFEIREYDGYAVAEVTMSGTFDRATSRSFRPFYRHISGENRARTDMDMTTPVLVAPTSEEMDMTAPVLVEPAAKSEDHDLGTLREDRINSWTVAFVLPEPYTAATAPLPENARVTIRDVASHKVASIRFNGRFTNQAAETHRRLLEEWLAEQGLEHLGDWRVAGYDAPMTLPPLRRNEVMVTLP